MYDYIIFGSGIAGLYTALLAREHGRVLILTKGSIDECNTRHAQGGIAAAVGATDSPELHYQDTLRAGAGLCDPESVRILTEEAADRIRDLIGFGVPFDTIHGQIALGREGAHSVPRVLHAGGDATGEKIELTLSYLAQQSNITILEHHLVTAIHVEKGSVDGVTACDCRLGREKEFAGRFVVAASGGAGQLFKFNTNPPVTTGDGIALAYRAGAEIADMEFFQFHPTALCMPGVPRFLISEAVRGEGGILYNASGHRFMPDYDQRAELAARDIVARAILAEMGKNGNDCVYLDVTHLPAATVIARFPSIYRFCLEHGLDITTSPIPVAPAAHYTIGGIRTNAWGETNIPGLFACGEVACTGVHGANRLASNSLLEVVVFGKRIVEGTRRGLLGGHTKATDDLLRLSLEEPKRRLRGIGPSAQADPPSLTALQSLMWDKVGIVRDRASLERGRDTLTGWLARLGGLATRPEPTDRASHELTNLLLVGRMMAEAALVREESRGAHYRTDFPQESPAWLRHIVFRKP